MMKLYDELIENIQKLISPYDKVLWQGRGPGWPEDPESSLILRRDMAYELGNESHWGIGMTLVTSAETGEKEPETEDRVILIGEDLKDIKADGDYARISIVRVDGRTMGEGQALYKAVKKLDYTRYHFYPRGFMLRLSALQKREGARVGRKDLPQGLSFENVGRALNAAYHKNQKVLSAVTVFITASAFPYEKLKAYAAEADAVTAAIDHIAQNVEMDCQACGLQKVCEEVEGLRELHFGQKKGEAT